MRNQIITFLFLFGSQILFAQTPISGVINNYALITAIDTCGNKLTVDNSTFFAENQLVIIIQMKGATIAQNNNSDFGNITNLGSAGLFEKGEILSISNNEIILKNLIVNEYDVNGLVQLVTLPKYENAVVEAPLTGNSWNGNTGGVIAIEVENTLTLEADIMAVGLGFRGGNIDIKDSDCNFLTNANGYIYGENTWKGSIKGEGVAAIIQGKEKGRGAQANGGGGGNDHNAGGGGGANFSNGGQGGEQDAPGNFGCSGDYPGKGGKGLVNTENRLFLGGGGGSGHVDNNNAGSGGENGGGIIIIITNNLIAGSNKIVAHGLTPILAGGDGAGGGGGGGTILLSAQNIMGIVPLEANGGDGGDVVNPSSRCFGPGGGGSGGRILTNIANGSTSLMGGEAGVNSTNSSQCNGLSNEATNGQGGSLSTIVEIPQGDEAVMETAFLQQPLPATICEEDAYLLETNVAGNNLSFQWQANTGNGFFNLLDGPNFSGVMTANLLINNPSLSMNQIQYQLVVANDCSGEILSEIATIEIMVGTIPDFTFTNQGDGLVQFTNLSTNFNSIFWDFGDLNMSTDVNPIHQYDEEGFYLVELTVFGDCDTISTIQTVAISIIPIAGFSSIANDDCVPVIIQFTNESSSNATSFSWTFEGGEPALSFLENPIVTFNNGGVFDVTLNVSNDEGDNTLVETIIIQSLPIANFDFSVSGLVADFNSLSLGFTGDLLWDFGDGNTSNELNPTHLYVSTGTYIVTLIATNDCGEVTFTQEVSTGGLPNAAFSSMANSNCVPITIFFTNTSSGQDITEWFWEFPGGMPATSTEENPQIMYVTPGMYDVALTVTNDLGENTTTFTNHVMANDFPDAAFDVEIDEFTVNFINNSIGGNTYSWDFGDNSSGSNTTNPTHTYSSGGIYAVTLIASNFSCANASSMEIYIDPVATKEEANDDLFNVYPNPARKELTVKLRKYGGLSMEVRLYDINGRMVKEKTALSEGEVTFDIEDLACGVYFVEVWNKDYFSAMKFLKE